jgi:Spy/CpxP family protein refolding chaperone
VEKRGGQRPTVISSVTLHICAALSFLTIPYLASLTHNRAVTLHDHLGLLISDKSYNPEGRRMIASKRRIPLKTFLFAALLVAGICLSLGSSALAQSAQSQSKATEKDATAQQIELMRKDLRSIRKQLVAANLKLTDDQATRFWPVYDQYIAELVKVNNTKYELLKEYFDSYGTLTPEQADSMTKRLLELDVSVAQLRQKYQPNFRAVLPAKETATFFQIDRRIAMMIDLQLASQIPLVQE